MDDDLDLDLFGGIPDEDMPLDEGEFDAIMISDDELDHDDDVDVLDLDDSTANDSTVHTDESDDSSEPPDSPHSSVSITIVDPAPSGQQQRLMRGTHWQNRAVGARRQDSELSSLHDLREDRPNDSNSDSDSDVEIVQIGLAEQRRRRQEASQAWRAGAARAGSGVRTNNVGPHQRNEARAGTGQQRTGAPPPHLQRARGMAIARRPAGRGQDVLVGMELARPGNNAIIDLTEEADTVASPSRHLSLDSDDLPLGHGNNQATLPFLNPRRRLALNHRTPSLNRTDGSILPAPVIDLTNESDGGYDDDDDVALFLAEGNLEPPRPVEPRIPQIPAFFQYTRDLGGQIGNILFRDANINNFHEGFRAALHGLGNNMAAITAANHANNPLAGNMPNLNYGQRHGAQMEPGVPQVIHLGRSDVPKPRYDELPPARPGFTRSTGDEDVVIICAGCDGELKYGGQDDEEEKHDQPHHQHQPPPAKKARRRRDQEEHNFWAVRACGHVYCKHCYENRRNKPSTRASKGHAPPPPTNFRIEQLIGARAPKFFCAVEGCQSEVGALNSWVGIFM